ncbi:hypothetical protein BFP72_02655 [Reichenbachiella sp. 5M10]|uniref:hypothetical protein n=1 Tax=Reichenbachiella sp. 5M10 TaxID=1889772 RepID=UPI000C15ACE2|nr:hypothetical protein [Reichenbachiella sp. 5M10]PIB34400.1 hypothetical protein BFP72_02655 [Reichenbachiella sp. 5M10]
MPLRLLHISQSIGEEAKALLAQNRIGTPNESPVYQQLSTRDKLSHITRPHLLSLSKSHRTLGVCCFCERSSRLDQQPVTSFYVRYFSFLDQLRVNHRKTTVHSKKNSIKTEVHSVLSGQEIMPNPSHPNYFYAYVDPNNVRSALLCEEFGFEKIRSFNTHMLGRLFPKERLNCQRIDSIDHEEVKKLLHTYYARYSSYSTENLFYREQYYVVRDASGQILAGAQANPESWIVHSLPALSGKILLNILGKLPLFNRLICRNYRFLALDYLYIRPGHEHILAPWIETLLAKTGTYTAMILADKKSPLRTLLSSVRPGLIGRAKKPLSIDIIIKDNHLTPNQKKELKNHPFFLSSFDTT